MALENHTVGQGFWQQPWIILQVSPDSFFINLLTFLIYTVTRVSYGVLPRTKLCWQWTHCAVCRRGDLDLKTVFLLKAYLCFSRNRKATEPNNRQGSRSLLWPQARGSMGREGEQDLSFLSSNSKKPPVLYFLDLKHFIESLTNLFDCWRGFLGKHFLSFVGAHRSQW